MPSCSNALSTKVGSAKNQKEFLSTDTHGRILKPGEDKEREEEEEEEDEDADFNPFLKETPSQEASSSLSSEVDGLDGGVVSSGLSVDTSLSKLTSKEQLCAVGDSEHGEEEIVMQSTLSLDETCEKELNKNSTCDSKKRKSTLISQSETDQEKDNGLNSETNNNDIGLGELSNATKSQSPILEIDNEDAICTRTRARYSLAGFTLDELETFLQETDDDDELQNVDDEEEYRKFLAAVLQDGDDGLSTHGNENVDDEDEDNDADFEIELEELLESDVDENAAVKSQKEYDGAGRRPETRQNRRQRASSQCVKKIFGQVKRPLRPLLPSFPNGPLALGKCLLPEATLSFQSSASGNVLVNGFTPQQIGQLYTLIHEHVQLLIQVFSLSILDPSRQHIASQVQGLLLEMLHNRDEVSALKNVPYPSICFSSPYVRSSVSKGVSKHFPDHSNTDSASTYDAQRACLPQPNESSSEGRCEYVLNGKNNSFQDTEGPFWVPIVRGPVLSILDVSPLNLVGRYVDDVFSAVQEYQKRYLESDCSTHVEKEPLFPCLPSFSEVISEVSSGKISTDINTVSTSPAQQQPKKTLAAMLVESTKKQSIAFVPKEIAKLTQRFLPLFNSELYPHKPPPPAVVNRVLFTDSEDELLAVGLMEYNTDWKAIQQRFLPCKSKHQIFVRQKNRCSSKAPENPIKAVRRMKTSPLTPEEIACIQEGLKAYKFDWMSVWQYIVPHRDPSLLPRQWRIALGTQKSYKGDAIKKEKRRLYESRRRKLKSAALEGWQATSDKEDCQADIVCAENRIENAEFAFVHQAFLADWRPDKSTLTFEGFSSTSREENLVNDAMPPEHTQFYGGQQSDYCTCGKAQPQIGNRSAFPSVCKLPHASSDLRSSMHGATTSAIGPKNPVFDMTTSRSKYYYRPYRSRRVNNTHLVKLAPDLPPVNLPPSVRIVSQTAYKGYHFGTSNIHPPGGGGPASRKDNSASKIPQPEKFRSIHPVKGTRQTPKDSVTGFQQERSGTVGDISAVAEKGTSTDLQMHPLLFQATVDGNIPYYPLHFSSGISSSFSFASGSQPQLNLSLFHRPHHVECSNKSSKSKDSTASSGGIDFHPLLQKSGEAQLQTSFDAIQTKSLVNSGMPAMVNESSVFNETSNELDLEIHLSSASGKEKSMKSRELKAYDPIVSTTTGAICGTALQPQENNAPYGQQGETDFSVRSDKLASCAHPLIGRNDSISRCDVDDIGDQSHPEIVMEQEELSDSEEDIEEHVEFECEEMADSEGEDGSGCEQVLKVQHKEVPTSAVEKMVKHTAGMEKPCELQANFGSQVDDSLLINGTSTLKMAVTDEGKGDKSSSPWLNLDSYKAGSPVLSKNKHEGGTIGAAPTPRNLAVSRPSKYCKKTRSCSKAVTEDRHTTNMVQQISQGPLVFAAPRKPRKRSGKSTASLNTGLTIESSDHDNKDG